MIFLSHGKVRANIKALIAIMLQRYIYCRYLHVQHWTLAIVGTHNNPALPAHVEKSHSQCTHQSVSESRNFLLNFFFYKTYVSNRHLFWTNIGRGSLLSPNIKIYNLICCPCTFQSYGWSGDKKLSNCVKEFNLFPPSLPHCFLTLWH